MRPHWKGPALALAAAALFGASTPFSKILLRDLSPQWLAGLLYLGSGVGLALWMLIRSVAAPHAPREASLQRADMPWLGGAILAGGILAPLCLAWGLRGTAATSASLMLNLEGVFTALLAWFVFRENFDRRIFLGMLAIVAGGLILSWEGRAGGVSWAAIGIATACFGWALDNNLTRKVSAADPVHIAMLKGLVAGSVNVALAATLAPPPAWSTIGASAVLGFLSYGLSLTFFVLALRHLGAARTGAYFSTAPFVGAALSLALLAERPGVSFWAAAACMAVGVWLHLTEHHSHKHTHEPLEHDLLHVHDEHHQHEHTAADPPGEPHSHPHRHTPLTHTHPHVPDLHHRHHH
jgi:drug/metabolite transporter (DMT)-like permease